MVAFFSAWNKSYNFTAGLDFLIREMQCNFEAVNISGYNIEQNVFGFLRYT